MLANRLVNGEMQAKNPAGLPPRNPERIISRDGQPDQEWWLRSNDRSRFQSDGAAFTYYSPGAACLKKNNFQAGSIDQDHSRRVFKELARQGHSFSEANLQALKNDRQLRKTMQKKYFEVMGAAPAPPGPANKPMLRSQSTPSLPTEKALRALDVPGPSMREASVVSMMAPGQASVVSMAPSFAAASRISATAPLRASSMVSMSMPEGGGGGSVVNSMVEGGRAASGVGPAASGVGPNQPALSESDFYAWRPRLLR